MEPERVRVSWWPTKPRAWQEVHALAEIVTRCRLPVVIGLERNPYLHGYDVYATATGKLTPEQARLLRRQRRQK